MCCKPPTLRGVLMRATMSFLGLLLPEAPSRIAMPRPWWILFLAPVPLRCFAASAKTAPRPRTASHRKRCGSQVVARMFAPVMKIVRLKSWERPLC